MKSDECVTFRLGDNFWNEASEICLRRQISQATIRCQTALQTKLSPSRLCHNQDQRKRKNPLLCFRNTDETIFKHERPAASITVDNTDSLCNYLISCMSAVCLSVCLFIDLSIYLQCYINMQNVRISIANYKH